MTLRHGIVDGFAQKRFRKRRQGFHPRKEFVRDGFAVKQTLFIPFLRRQASEPVLKPFEYPGFLLENVTGTLEPGKSADIVLINVDLERIPVEEIYDVKADITMFKGKIVHSRF